LATEIAALVAVDFEESENFINNFLIFFSLEAHGGLDRAVLGGKRDVR
jgi:hypothetical protein